MNGYVISATAAQSSSTDGVTGLVFGLVVLAVLCGYFLPSIIALSRGVNLAYVLCINLFFGWTFIGWLSAFIAACATKIYLDTQPVTVVFNSAAAAGWWPDPTGTGLRYWDGYGWTEHTTGAVAQTVVAGQLA